MEPLRAGARHRRSRPPSNAAAVPRSSRAASSAARPRLAVEAEDERDGCPGRVRNDARGARNTSAASPVSRGARRRADAERLAAHDADADARAGRASGVSPAPGGRPAAAALVGGREVHETCRPWPSLPRSPGDSSCIMPRRPPSTAGPGRDAVRLARALAADERAVQALEQVGHGREARVRVRRERGRGHVEALEAQERISGRPSSPTSLCERKPAPLRTSGSAACAATRRALLLVMLIPASDAGCGGQAQPLRWASTKPEDRKGARDARARNFTSSLCALAALAVSRPAIRAILRPVKIGILGAGAIGCFLGGRLIAAGHEVVLVGRLGDEIRASGLDAHGLRRRPRRARAGPGALRRRARARSPRSTSVLVTVKSAGDRGRGAPARVDPGARRRPIVSFQNGVSNPSRLRAVLPGHPVLAGMVPFNVARTGPGCFHNGTSGPLAIEDGRRRRAADRRRAARAPASTSSSTRRSRPLQWSKLLVNLNNAVNALARRAALPADPRSHLPPRDGDVRARGRSRCMRASGLRVARVGRMIPRSRPSSSRSRTRSSCASRRRW